MISINHLVPIVGILICPTTLVHAANWNFTPYVSLAEIYTDNVRLAPRGDEQDEFITVVNPGFSLRRDEGRIRANVAYQMQNLFYARDSDANETFHQLDALGVAEILREHFFIDAASSISQQVIDAEQAAPLSNRSVTGNRTDVVTASVSPYLRQEFGSTQALARYRYGIVNFDDSDVAGITNDATVNGESVAIGSPPSAKRLSWLGAYDRKRVDFDGINAADVFEQAGLRFDYRLTRTLGLVGLGGYEDDQFRRTGNTLDPNGTFWEAGVRLEPGARDLIEARYGERFFGNTVFFSWDHTGRRFATQIAYSEDVTTVAQSLLGDTQELLDYGVLNPSADTIPSSIATSASPFTDSTGIDPDTGLPIGGADGASATDPSTGLPLGGLSLTSDVFVAKRLEASIAFDGAKTETRINIFQEDRNFENATINKDERARGIQALFDWQFASRTDLIAGADYAREHFGGNDSTADLLRFSLGLQHVIGPRTFGRLAGERTQRTSDDNLDEYTENAVILSVTHQF